MEGHVDNAGIIAFMDQLEAMVAERFGRRWGLEWLTRGTITDAGELHKDGYSGGDWKPGEFEYLWETNGLITVLELLRTAMLVTGPASAGTAHTHTLPWPVDPVLPALGGPLQPGDRVLIAWLTGHTKPLVIGRVLRSEA